MIERTHNHIETFRDTGTGAGAEHGYCYPYHPPTHFLKNRRLNHGQPPITPPRRFSSFYFLSPAGCGRGWFVRGAHG